MIESKNGNVRIIAEDKSCAIADFCCVVRSYSDFLQDRFGMSKEEACSNVYECVLISLKPIEELRKEVARLEDILKKDVEDMK